MTSGSMERAALNYRNGLSRRQEPRFSMLLLLSLCMSRSDAYLFIHALQPWSGSWIDFEFNVMPLHDPRHANHQRRTVHQTNDDLYHR